MPYSTEWRDPELFLDYRGVQVYRTYKDADMSRGRLTWWFTTSEACDGDNCDCLEEGLVHFGCRHFFDVRSDLGLSGPADASETAIKAVLIDAIDRGALTADGVAGR